jgi:acetylornithine deacetylase
MTAPTLLHVSEILEKLVGFDTTSHASNLALIAWVEQYLTTLNVPHERVNAHEGKASLLARIGPEVAGGIVLSGHTDVVPTREQKWTTAPYVLSFRDGRYHGRGTADMKSFLALALAFIPHWQQQNRQKPIWLAFSHDEEIGCLGAAPMAQQIVAKNIVPALVVVGEPTMMQLVTAHKAIHSFETIVTGREAHSSLPEQGVNAVMIMGEIIHHLNEIAASLRAGARADCGFHPPYSTLHVGVVEGGTARNIIPRHCRIAWEIRPLPGADVAAILAPFTEFCVRLEIAMKQTDPMAAIVTRKLTQVAGLQPVAESASHLVLAKHLAASNHVECVSYGTEGGIFQSHGLPVVICGPGSIEQAHQPDEFIEISQIERGMEFMARL